MRMSPLSLPFPSGGRKEGFFLALSLMREKEEVHALPFPSGKQEDDDEVSSLPFPTEG